MNRTILVVDDEPDVRMVIRLLLQDEGYTVLEADSGEEALEVIKRESPESIFLDLRMPGIGGWGVIEALKADSRIARCRVIVVSAHASPGTMSRAMEQGCAAYITKPFTAKDLMNALGVSLCNNATL